jgi:hypothetical protein
MGIRTEEVSYTGMSEEEKTAYCEKCCAEMHADNVCYTGSFLPEVPPKKKERRMGEESAAAKAGERRRKARHETHYEFLRELSSPE